MHKEAGVPPRKMQGVNAGWRSAHFGDSRERLRKYRFLPPIKSLNMHHARKDNNNDLLHAAAAYRICAANQY